MKEKNIHLPFVFIVVSSLIFMGAILLTQLQSSSIIKQLKSGNTQAINTIQVENLTDDIINETFVIEDNSKRFLAYGHTINYHNLRDTLTLLEKDNSLMASFPCAENIKPLVENFISLAKRKTDAARKITLSMSEEDKQAITTTITNERNNIIADSLYTMALLIQQGLEKDYEITARKNEKLSGQVLSLGRILGLISVGAIALLATIILRRLLSHYRLIRKLHHTNEDLQNAKQQTEHAANVKEQFLSNMSHEIRTPVNSVIGFTNLLQKTKLQPDQQQFVGLIKTAGENLLNIINDILDISKIEAGMLHFDKNPFDLRELCYSVEMQFYHPISEKKLFFQSEISDDVPEVVSGDKERLTQILANLISNAIKFTSKGGITLKIGVANKKDKNITLLFSVKDTGIGIPAEKIETIFERFEQAEASTTRNYGGTGLGLAIVKKLIGMQGGKVWATSKPGVGSEFFVEVPFEKGEIDLLDKIRFTNPTGNSYLINEEQQQLVSNRILAAEDNKMNQMLLSYTLKGWNIDYDIAENGQDAVEKLKKTKYDLVLMDIQMPLMDGYTATKHIRNELKMEIPVIAMTAKVLPGEKEKCQSMGMDDYISKPLNEKILYDMLNKYLPDNKNNPKIMKQENLFIDKSYLNRIYEGNDDFIKELVQQFLLQFKEEFNKLENAVATRDHKVAASISHTMKTTVSSMNVTSPLMEPLQAIETAENKPTGWEIINYNMNTLMGYKQGVIRCAEEYLLELA
jgi:signal transduction histidine kinase/CheY-like chemotaxis protein